MPIMKIFSKTKYYSKEQPFKDFGWRNKLYLIRQAAVRHNHNFQENGKEGIGQNNLPYLRQIV